MEVDGPQITVLLRAWSAGDQDAFDQLAPLVYEELRQRAAAYLRRERREHILNPTALVHEAFVRLMDQDRIVWKNRSQFFGVASQLMRRVLVDQARTRNADKRSGRWARVSLSGLPRAPQADDVEVIDLDRALTELAKLHARQARVAELRFFGGLSLEEIAAFLEVSRATVERDWQVARAWLFRRLSGQATP